VLSTIATAARTEFGADSNCLTNILNPPDE
jgi:hypothetical protein